MGNFFKELKSGNVVGAVVGLVVHLVLMALFVLLLGLTAPLLAVAMPFVAYSLSSESIGLFTFFYFFFGAFASAMFTNIVYCRLTRKERRARGETFGQHCRAVAGWPTLSIICSWAADFVFFLMFRDLVWSDSNVAHFIFFALAPVAVFSPTWIYLIRRRRQRMAMEELHKKFEARSRLRDAEFLRSQGIVG